MPSYLDNFWQRAEDFAGTCTSTCFDGNSFASRKPCAGTYIQSSFIEGANPFAKLIGPSCQIFSFPFSSKQSTVAETCLSVPRSVTHSPPLLLKHVEFWLINEVPPAPSANLSSFIVLSVNFHAHRCLRVQIASHDESGEKAIPRSNPSVLAISFTLLPSGDTL